MLNSVNLNNNTPNINTNMKSLFLSYNMLVESAYIIRIKDNHESQRMADCCAESCKSVGQPHVFWDAYDGTADRIVVPDHHNSVMDLIKVTDHYLTRTEVAAALSHISLWTKCMLLDRPIVILEHDAIMLQPYTQHLVFNSIAYLGSFEQARQGWAILPTPIHASEGPNYRFMCRAHAYAIDPAVAKNLLAHVIKYGICAPLDIMIRADIFPMHQMGLVAYNESYSTNTISGRPAAGRSTTLNNNLEL